MNKTITNALHVFDELEKEDQAFNIYQYMLKLGSEAVGHLVLGMDFGHFKEIDA